MKLYIFIGVYQGVIDEVVPYANETAAMNAWSDYTEEDYLEYREDSSLLEDTDYEGSTIYIATVNDDEEQ